MIINRSTPTIKTENRPKVHFYRNTDTLELYKEPNFNSVTGQLIGFPISNNVDLLNCIENNHTVVNQDYQKLVNHSNNVAIIKLFIIIKNVVIRIIETSKLLTKSMLIGREVKNSVYSLFSFVRIRLLFAIISLKLYFFENIIIFI